MTPEAQCIAVALAVGCTATSCNGDIEWRKPDGTFIGRYTPGHYPSLLPRYTTDLNAIREAILSLPTADISGKDQVSVHRHLGYVCKDPNHMRTWLASPAELTEAFLRALNLWVEE